MRELIIMAPESAGHPGNGIRLTNGVYLVVQNNGLSVLVSCRKLVLDRMDRMAVFLGNGPIL